MKDTAKLIACIPLLLCCLYLGAAGAAWQIRNPMANRWTFWSHFPQAMRFEKLPEFQPK